MSTLVGPCPVHLVLYVAVLSALPLVRRDLVGPCFVHLVLHLAVSSALTAADLLRPLPR